MGLFREEKAKRQTQASEIYLPSEISSREKTGLRKSTLFGS